MRRVAGGASAASLLLAQLQLLLLLRGVRAQEPAPAQLSNASTCEALGFGSLAGYLARLPLASPYGRATATPIFLPLYATLPDARGLGVGDAVYSNITAAVIYLHGLSGAANSYFCAGAAAAAAHGGVLSLAPWFGDEQVDSRVWGGATAGAGASAFWSVASRWLTGGNTSPSADGASPQTRWSTAFDALDALVAALRAGGGFPALRLITIAGFSAGSQVASRYAVASAMAAPPAPGAPVERIIVSDPASFMYLDGARPAPACRPLRDTGVDWQCDSFVVPPEAAACPQYDDYKYGTQDMGVTNAYTAKFDADPALLAAAISRFASKDIVYIFGALDVCNCNAPGFVNAARCFIEGAQCLPDAAGGPGCCDTTPDAPNNMVDDTCSAMVQGSNRLQRGVLYYQYLEQLYAASGERFAHRLAFGNFAHDNAGEYASAAFQQLAYSP